MSWACYTYSMPRKIQTESPDDVVRWLREQSAELWPAALGSLTYRRCPCIRENCPACRSGEKHPSYLLNCRIKGRYTSVYIPEELVPQIERCLDNGRALEGLLREAAERYAKALKYARTQKAKG